MFRRLVALDPETDSKVTLFRSIKDGTVQLDDPPSVPRILGGMYTIPPTACIVAVTVHCSCSSTQTAMQRSVIARFLPTVGEHHNLGGHS